MAELKKMEGVSHKSVVHFWRKVAVSIHQQHNVPMADIEKVGWAARNVANKCYNKEIPCKFLVGAAGCALRKGQPLNSPTTATWPLPRIRCMLRITLAFLLAVPYSGSTRSACANSWSWRWSAPSAQR